MYIQKPSLIVCLACEIYYCHTSCADIVSDQRFISCFPICLQDSLLTYGNEALSRKGNDLKQEELVKKLGQTSLMIGAFTLATFAVLKTFS